MRTIDHAMLERWRHEALHSLAVFAKVEAELPQCTSALSEVVEILAERLLTLVEDRLRLDAHIAFVTAADLTKWQTAVGVMNRVAGLALAGRQAEFAAQPSKQLEDAMMELSGAATVLVPAFAAIRR